MQWLSTIKCKSVVLSWQMNESSGDSTNLERKVDMDGYMSGKKFSSSFNTFKSFDVSISNILEVHAVIMGMFRLRVLFGKDWSWSEK